MSNKIIGTRDIERMLKSENPKDIYKLYKIYINLDIKDKFSFMDKFNGANYKTNNMYKYVSKSIYFTNLILKSTPKDENLYRLLKLIDYQYNKCTEKEKNYVEDWFRDNIIIENNTKLKKINIKTNRPIKERESIANLFLNTTFKSSNCKYINKEVKNKVVKFVEKSLLINIKNIDLNNKKLNIEEINEILQLNKKELCKKNTINKKDIDKYNNKESNRNKIEVDKDKCQENTIKKEDIAITESKIDNIEKELESKPKLNQIQYMFNDVCTYIETLENENKIKEESIKKYELRCENEKKINDSLNNILQTKDEELNKFKLEIDRLKSSIQYKETEYQKLLNTINVLNSEKEKIEEEIENKNIEIAELKETSIKLANINTKEANNEFNGYKNRLSSKLKLYYSEFNECKDVIQNDSDRAQFLQDQLDGIFRILMNSDIKLK